MSQSTDSSSIPDRQPTCPVPFRPSAKEPIDFEAFQLFFESFNQTVSSTNLLIAIDQYSGVPTSTLTQSTSQSSIITQTTIDDTISKKKRTISFSVPTQQTSLASLNLDIELHHMINQQTVIQDLNTPPRANSPQDHEMHEEQDE